MSFDYTTVDLPVKDVIPQIEKELSASNTLIVKAPPGAGKSTLLPLALMDTPWLEGKKIIMLEPRRLAAKTIEVKATVDLKQEERQEEFMKGATATEAKVVRTRAHKAVRKAEKEAVLAANRAAALAGPPVAIQAEAIRHAAEVATAAAVHIGSENEEDDADDDDVFKAAEEMVVEASATDPPLFREGAAHQESPVLHPRTQAWVTCPAYTLAKT